MSDITPMPEKIERLEIENDFLAKEVQHLRQRVAELESSGLTFQMLRDCNVQRCTESFHPLDHWNSMEWGAACAGEVGEGINAAKKLRRVQDSEQYKKALPTTDVTSADVVDEIADAVIYADLWAASIGADLGAAIASKFNRTSVKVKSDVRLPELHHPDELECPDASDGPWAEGWEERAGANWPTCQGNEMPPELAPAQIVVRRSDDGAFGVTCRADADAWHPGDQYRPALDADGLPMVSREGLDYDAQYVAKHPFGPVGQHREKPVPSADMTCWFNAFMSPAPYTHRIPGDWRNSLASVWDGDS